MQGRTSSPSRRLKARGPVAGVFGLVLACYWPALRGGLLWDDPAQVTRPELRSWAGVGLIWLEVRAPQQYYPVVHTAVWVEHRLWGDATLGDHPLNVRLHATACCLLAPGTKSVTATLATALWLDPNFEGARRNRDWLLKKQGP
jgi:protein O-mannosyl-transferase